MRVLMRKSIYFLLNRNINLLQRDIDVNKNHGHLHLDIKGPEYLKTVSAAINIVSPYITFQVVIFISQKKKIST